MYKLEQRADESHDQCSQRKLESSTAPASVPSTSAIKTQVIPTSSMKLNSPDSQNYHTVTVTLVNDNKKTPTNVSIRLK